MELRLNSPVGGLPAIYYWPLCKKKGYDEAKEIIETIIWGCSDIPDLSVPLKKNILKDVDVTCYDSMKALTKRYNKAINNILSLEKGTQKFCDRLNRIASKELLRHIIQQTYSAAVTDAEELNKYQAFSPDVYGETSFDLISQMLEVVKPTKDDVFVDLGSGVGQVVLQMAAASICRHCIGIERADVPTKYAESMETKFRFWMQWYGKRYGSFELIKGDFFDDTHRNVFSDSTIIFVNNFAFGPSVDHKLKERFAEFKQGTKIVSSRSFCPLNFRISDRNLGDIGTIINVSEIAPVKSSVSWTDKPVSYYLHTIDRTKLEKYFQAKKNGSLYSFSTEDTETSCDSFSTESPASSEINLVIEPPPKRRKRTNKSKEPDLRNNISLDKQNGYSDKTPKQILRPSKLILHKPPHQDKQNTTTKQKTNSRSSSPDNAWTRVLKNNGENGFKNPHPVIQNDLTRMMNDFKLQYMKMVNEMSDPQYKLKIRRCLEDEIKRHIYLKTKMKQINQEIEGIVVQMQTYIRQKRS